MCVSKLTGDAQGLAIFQRQIAYPCAKYKHFFSILCVVRVFSKVACKEISKIEDSTL